MNSYLPDEVFEGFQTVTLGEVMRASLTNRLERKYIFSTGLLPDILNNLKKDYDLMVIADQPVQLYESVYFDTAAFSTYLDHHNGLGNRYKVRLRKYHSTSVCFLEVKHRLPTNEVKKTRIQVPDLSVKLLSYADFIRANTPYYPECLEEKIRSFYYRVTLVHKNLEERATFDFGLHYYQNGENRDFSTLVIGELKFSKDLRRPSCQNILQSYHIRSTNISKYCTGIVSLYPYVKKNRFKEKIREIHKIISRNNKYAIN